MNPVLHAKHQTYRIRDIQSLDIIKNLKTCFKIETFLWIKLTMSNGSMFVHQFFLHYNNILSKKQESHPYIYPPLHQTSDGICKH